MLLPVLLAGGVFLLACGATWRFRTYALARRLLDLPNERSSHTVATPRGGGVAIVLAMLIALPLLGSSGALAWHEVWAFCGAGVLVALVGFRDDHAGLPPLWRLVAHAAAAAWLIAWLGGMPPSALFGLAPTRWLADAFAVLYVVWLVNLTNFMDGIDGLAGLEAVTVCAGGTVLYLVAFPRAGDWLTPFILASATLGFLVWNWPPARIFMGDVGSGFLGVMLGGCSLRAAWTAPELFWAWVILLGAFIADATVTLFKRVARGERFYEAHRCHAYQRAAVRWGAHRPVTLAFGAINVCWLLPVALLVATRSLAPLSGVITAYMPLLAAALWLGSDEDGVTAARARSRRTRLQ